MSNGTCNGNGNGVCSAKCTCPVGKYLINSKCSLENANDINWFSLITVGIPFIITQPNITFSYICQYYVSAGDPIDNNNNIVSTCFVVIHNNKQKYTNLL